jgi:GTPase SAR1 family protein
MELSTQIVADPSSNQAPQTQRRRPKSVDEVIALERQVQDVYDTSLAPLANKFTFRLGVAKTDAIGLPTVLLLGNHSSGKSTLINHLFGTDIQKTGVAPVDDGFTLIMHGDEHTTLDGKAVVTHPKLPYRALEQFGPVFVSRLKLKQRFSDILKSIVLIDSPGMIDTANPASTRGYDFTAVVRHFAENADLVVFFFDPDKPGTTRESLSVFTDALSGVAHKLLIVMNKVDLFPNIRDFARAYGALCWNLAHVIKTKDLPHIFCTYIETEGNRDAAAHTNLPLGDFKAARDEVIDEIDRAPERRSDNLVSTLYDTARRLQVHARVSSALAAQYRSAKIKTGLLGVFIAVLSFLAAGYFFKMQGRDSLLKPEHYGPILGGLALAFLVVWIGGMIVNALSNRSIAGIDEVFHDEYEHELTMQDNKADLEALWDSTKPHVVEYLKKTGIENVPRKTLFNKSIFQQLDLAIAEDIPRLRRNLTKP